MKRNLTILCLLGAAATASAGGGPPGPAAPTGWVAPAEIRVVIAADAPPLIAEAADELGRVLGGALERRHTVSRASHGGGAPGDIHLGTTPLQQLFFGGESPPRYAWRMNTQARRLFLYGADSQTTAAAAWWFLQEHAGARWLFPGPLGEIVPPRERLSVRGGARTVRPSYESRAFFARSGAFQQWSRRNLLVRAHRFHHNLHRIFDEAAYASHSEWFPLIGNRRRPSGGRAPQPNLAHPGAADYAATRAAAFFAAHPDEPTFSLGMVDSVSFDESPLTRELVRPLRFFRGQPDYSDLVFTFMNRAAERLDAWGYPDRQLGCLAYAWAENTPSFPVDADVLPYLTADRSFWFDPAYRAEDRALMARWGDSGVRAFGLYGYWYGYPFFIPRVFFDEIGEVIPYAHNQGARGFIAEAWPVWPYDGPKVWLGARLLRDVSEEPEALLDEYFTAAYGPAAEPVRAFFAEADAAWEAQPGEAYWIKYHYNPAQAEVLPPGRRARMSAHLDEARARLADSPGSPYARRLERLTGLWAVTRGLCGHYEAWRELARPGGLSSAADARRAAANQKEATRLLTELLPYTTTVPSPKSPFPNQFIANPAARYWAREAPEQPGWRLLAAEGFEEPLLRPARPGEAGDPFALKDRWRSPLWQARFTVSEGLTLEQPTGEGGRSLALRGVQRFSMATTLGVEPGGAYCVRLRVRAAVASACRVQLLAAWVDEQGNIFGERLIDRLPPGETGGWTPLAVAGEAPPEARQLYVGLHLNFQESGDFAQFDDVEVYAIPAGHPALGP